MKLPAVLHVDDNDEDVFLFRHAWKQVAVPNPLYGIGSFAEAVDYFEGRGRFADRESHPLPCLVLVDLQLLGGDGLELLRWIRADSRFNSVRVVLLTGSANKQDAERASRLGADSFIVKPQRQSDLIETVRLIRASWLTPAAAET